MVHVEQSYSRIARRFETQRFETRRFETRRFETRRFETWCGTNTRARFGLHSGMKPFSSLLAVLLLTFAAAQSLNSARPASTSSASWQANAVFYEVFVRSFQDSNGDGIGDFNGLTSRLNDLKELGVTALWLMPIFPSPSYHGYDVTDYDGVNPQYGTMADFETMLAAAHALEMKVILDWVPNHSSREHPWFLESQKPEGAKRDWYVWRGNNPGWKRPWGEFGNVWHASGGAYYYGAFWEGMPDLNHRNPAVTASLNASARGWLDRGVDGFRVDAVRYVLETPTENTPDTPENIAWFERFSSFVKSVKPDAAVVGEIWTDVPTVGQYLTGASANNLAFNFDVYKGIKDSVGLSNREPVENVLANVAKAYPSSAIDALFITNHDQPRPKYFGNLKARSAADLLLTLPGTPFLYYGEEIGMPNGPSNADENKRTPMRWDETANAGFSSRSPWYGFSTDDKAITVAAQKADPGSLYTHYRNLIRVRQSQPALRAGSYRPIQAGARIMAFARTLEGSTIVVVINLDSDPGRAVMDLSAFPRGSVRELTLGKTLGGLTEANAKRYALHLGRAGLAILELGR
jgi:alpha-amylase